MRCTLKQLNEELKYKKPSEQVFFVSDSAEEIENFCEKMIKKEPEYIVVRLNPNRDMLMQLSDFLDGYNLDFIKLDAMWIFSKICIHDIKFVILTISSFFCSSAHIYAPFLMCISNLPSSTVTTMPPASITSPTLK